MENKETIVDEAELIKAAYKKGRLDQLREDANLVQGYKDRHNGHGYHPINYGTICDILKQLWDTLRDMEKSD